MRLKCTVGRAAGLGPAIGNNEAVTGRWTTPDSSLEPGTYLVFCSDGRGLVDCAGRVTEFKWRALSDKLVSIQWPADEGEAMLPFRMTDHGLHIQIGGHTDSETPLRYAGKPGTLEEERELGSARG